MPTPAEIGRAAASGSSHDKVGNPGENPEFTQGGAPAGPWFGSDLPVMSVPGGNPSTVNGYRPDSSQDQLPAPGSTDGDPRPPR